MRVAAVQVAALPSAAANRRLLAEITAEGALEGCGLVVLPEAVQRAIGGRGEPLAQEAEDLDGPFVELLALLADRHATTYVAGMFERSVDPDRPFNTTVVVDSSGLRARYRKIHLYDALGALESTGITPGPTTDENLVVVGLGDLSLGLQTCFDLRFPEMSRLLVDRGADLLVLGAAWYAGPGKIDQWRALSTARAIESTAYLVAAAQPGPTFCGTSRIVDPGGEVLAEAEAEGTSIQVAEIEPERIAEVRSSMPVLGARRASTSFDRR
jgi:predicted amidohydrolase